MKPSYRSTELEQEQEHLNKLYSKYTLNEDSQTRAMREFAFQIVEPYLDSGKCGLELGCSDGYFTEMLGSRLRTLDVVDGSIKFIEAARQRNLSNVSYHHALFEEFAPTTQYDYVFASYVLEHVLDPLSVLGMARRVLKPGGLVFIVVPNARALSRQLALHMGLYPDLTTLTENDLRFGHRRVYSRVLLDRDTEAAGFRTIAQGGIMLKILADFQMEKLIDLGILGEPQLKGLLKLGFEYPDLAGSLFSVCTH